MSENENNSNYEEDSFLRSPVPDGVTVCKGLGHAKTDIVLPGNVLDAVVRIVSVLPFLFFWLRFFILRRLLRENRIVDGGHIQHIHYGGALFPHRRGAYRLGNQADLYENNPSTGYGNGQFQHVQPPY